MAVIVDRGQRSLWRPFHALLLGGMFSLFLGALLSDLAYASSYEVQWKNFAAWLIVGGLVFGGFALVCSAVALARVDQRGGQATLHLLLLLAAWLLGFVNALVHAMDVWASMPASVVLSSVVVVLAIAAIGFQLAPRSMGEPR